MALSFTTLYGTAQLALQDALRRGVDVVGTAARVPNFVVVRLRRASFMAKFGWEPRENLERFRIDLTASTHEFIAAHGWHIGGSGTLVVNLVLVDVEEECTVDARFAQSFFTLMVSDDRGSRPVAVGSNPAVVGRSHELHPRGFVPLVDARKTTSREHLEMRFCDLRLFVRRVGRNLTTLNGADIGPEEVELHAGDLLRCGAVQLAVESIATA